MPTVPGALDAFIRDLAVLHERCLVESGRETARPGSCTSLIPPAENIHRVANAGSGRAISIHVYGADIERLGASINKTFDHLAIRPTWELANTTRRSWRAT